MSGFRTFKKFRLVASLPLWVLLIIALAFILPISTPKALAASDWYRLRTNSVPYQPQSVTLDSSGGTWVSAQDQDEYAPGVWHRPSGAPAGPSFQYITNDQRNNLLDASYNPPVVKPQLNAPVLYAVRDKAGNTWYAMKNRTVLCEKADTTWLTFTMPDSSSIQPGVDTTSVDSAFRIRLIDKPGGTQEVLLIANRGVIRVNAALAVAETRQVYLEYNNYFIRDVLIDSQGRYWVTSEKGVEMGTSLVITTYLATLFPTTPSAATGTMITRMVEDSVGNIWFGSDSYSGDGIYCYTAGGTWNKYTGVPVSTIGRNVHDIAAGSDGTVWFGGMYYDPANKATGGLLKYVPTGGGQWTQYTQADLGLESGNILSLAFDGTGIWFTTAYNPAITGNGTGVHYLTLNAQSQPNVTHYTYRGNSTALTSLRLNQIAADKSGGVWFPSYDDPSIARLKADGSWQQFRQNGSGSFGSFGFAGVAADSQNRVYFAPQNYPPVAYDVRTEQWMNLPATPFTEFYYYGASVDALDGKWFYGAYFVYYLNPDNTTWTSYSTATITPSFPANYNVDGLLADDAGNVWFMTWQGIVLMKKNPAGGDPTWFKFTAGSSGYTGGYRVYQDNSGQVWNADKQKFDSQNNAWLTVADTSAFDLRNLRFLNGTVPANMSLTGALAPVSALDQQTMTVDSRGTILFSGGMMGMSSVNVGIVAFGPLLKGTVQVTANAGGTGTGTVSSNPAGISYSYQTASNATASFNYGSTLVLTATAGIGSTVSWSDCAANGGVAGGTTAAATCSFTTVVSSKTVSAVFTRERYSIDVTVSGTGAGTVTSRSTTLGVTGVPNDMDCTTSTCSAGYPIGNVVKLTAVPGSTSTFDGWSALCTANPCNLTMNADKAVTVTFTRAPVAWNKTTDTKYYTSLAEALSSAQSIAEIWILDTLLTGAVTVDKSITLKGGWSATYLGKSGVPTTLDGNMTLMNGNSTAETIVVKGQLAVKVVVCG